jgi:hypothetical protein
MEHLGSHLVGTGVQPTDAKANEAAQRELEQIAAHDRVAAQHDRELPAHEHRRMPWDPQF